MNNILRTQKEIESKWWEIYDRLKEHEDFPIDDTVLILDVLNWVLKKTVELNA